MKKTVYMIGAVLVLAACTYNKWEEIKPKNAASTSACDTSATVSYAADIVPIMNASCGAQDNNCHSSGSVVGGNVVLDVQIGVAYCATTPTSGPNGQLVSCITWDGNTSAMPKNGSKLSTCDIMKIQKWVNEGAPDN